MEMRKYHGLGNDYIIINPAALTGTLSSRLIQRICHRHYGPGSDGILLGPLPSDSCDFAVRIFNPDGSIAEKSGNGLRIFARALWDDGLVTGKPFTVDTLGGPVSCRVHEGGSGVTVAMGRVRFDSEVIPVTGPQREVLSETITVAGSDFTFCAASLGNPHCVILTEEVSVEMAHKYGPLVEHHPYFPQRTNVQFMRVQDQHHIQIEIWERGAGYTLASGSSSSAAAAVAHRLGLCAGNITVHMPGGQLQVHLDEDMQATLIGPVVKVWQGEVAQETIDSVN